MSSLIPIILTLFYDNLIHLLTCPLTTLLSIPIYLYLPNSSNYLKLINCLTNELGNTLDLIMNPKIELLLIHI